MILWNKFVDLIWHITAFESLYIILDIKPMVVLKVRRWSTNWHLTECIAQSLKNTEKEGARGLHMLNAIVLHGHVVSHMPLL